MSRLEEARIFRETFGQEILDNISRYGFIKKQLWNMQTDLIEEEAAEFLEAADEVFADPENDKRREEMLKELCDLVFVCDQCAAAFSLDLDEALRRVFESNMSKLMNTESRSIEKTARFQDQTISLQVCLGFIHNLKLYDTENNVIAWTGRPSWIDDPASRLPVSCTVLLSKTVWKDPTASKQAGDSSPMPCDSEQELPCTSKIRPSRTDNGKGLVASGPVSFGKIYSCLNEQLRRGGVYKNGAVVLHPDIDHGDILSSSTAHATRSLGLSVAST